MAPSPRAAAARDGPSPRGGFEVADIVRAHGPEYLEKYPTSREQRAVLRAIGRCRTAALGGHVEGCDACGHRRIAYNSCRNRHCPKCQGPERARWLEAEQATLLPVPYFHVVFTLPSELVPLARANPRIVYGLLFRAASRTLLSFARSAKHLGGEPAITMVLHTWGQTLTEHPHVHCVVSGGGLSQDGARWVAVRRRGFLFPVRAMSALFRGKLLASLRRLRLRGSLRFVGECAELGDEQRWKAWLRELHGQPWVVYAKPPFGGPDRVLKYLSRYTHRVAISNRRILSIADGKVRFVYKDYAAGNATKQMTLSAAEFLRRFLLHVLPRGFMRIRHYGVLANCHREAKLARCRALLAVPSLGSHVSSPKAETIDQERRAPKPAPICPSCGAEMRILEHLEPRRLDTS